MRHTFVIEQCYDPETKRTYLLKDPILLQYLIEELFLVQYLKNQPFCINFVNHVQTNIYSIRPRTSAFYTKSISRSRLKMAASDSCTCILCQ